ncbi:putative phage infection protein [Corynebacterium resistens DSM 45100]|uniref:Phage infection protein n=1 Tax=Corynebacterium resistens (strain DSM 45100 / JCM 12819 / GTC 2026 / SICGH 158) TaxID=662755 RepID=F8DZN9_CORRG|nr:YhgE/Pip domain-containing protein [Corynebacterium resistens]AEI09087.1 putative phage infection protein [Corynebacterium resistens DSM 45100]
MLAGLKLNSEFLRLKRSRLTRLAVIFLCLMPLLYSALYLAAFWDPFNKVDQVPVALVNSDKGANVEGKELRAGDQVMQGLQDNDQIHWIVTDSEDAKKGVANGKYYFSLELPENFSEAVGSPTSDNPEKAHLISTYNDANGYLSTVIGQNVMREVLNVVGDKISSQAVDKILVGVMDAGSGLERAAIGAGQLANGTGELRNGSTKLDGGAGQLKDGLTKAKDGSTKLRGGGDQLEDGLSKLHDGSVQLADGTGQLATRVGAASQKIDAQKGNLDKLSKSADKLGGDVKVLDTHAQHLKSEASKASVHQAAQAKNLRKQARDLRALNIPAANGVAAQLEGVARSLETQGLGPQSAAKGKIDQLAQGSAKANYQLNNPNSELRGGLNKITGLPAQFTELKNGVNKINGGAIKLRDNLQTAHGGSVKLRDGIHQLDDGNTKLLDGSKKLKDGTSKAVDGTKKLDDGANQLHDKLTEGSKKVPQWDPARRMEAASTIGGPVEMDSFNDSGQQTFGGGLAPFFFSLALYIGGIIVFVMLRPLQARTVNSGIHSWRATLAGYLPSFLIGVSQALIMIAVTVWGVGLKPDSLLGLFAFSILVSAVYMAINQMFIAIFGPGPGKVLALAFLMLQMVSSGGLYPVETQDSFYQWIHPFNPMTYAVNGFRQITYGFYDERLPTAIIVLIVIGLGALLLTTISARSQRTWTMKRLHPPLPA